MCANLLWYNQEAVAHTHGGHTHRFPLRCVPLHGCCSKPLSTWFYSLSLYPHVSVGVYNRQQWTHYRNRCVCNHRKYPWCYTPCWWLVCLLGLSWRHSYHWIWDFLGNCRLDCNCGVPRLWNRCAAQVHCRHSLPKPSNRWRTFVCLLRLSQAYPLCSEWSNRCLLYLQKPPYPARNWLSDHDTKTPFGLVSSSPSGQR